jgi:hypothetical protein
VREVFATLWVDFVICFRFTRNEDRLLLRLHDDAFMRVCNMMNDEWNGVRVRAAQSLVNTVEENADS